MQYAITSINSLFHFNVARAIRVTEVSALGTVTTTRLLNKQIQISNEKEIAKDIFLGFGGIF